MSGYSGIKTVWWCLATFTGLNDLSVDFLRMRFVLSCFKSSRKYISSGLYLCLDLIGLVGDYALDNLVGLIGDKSSSSYLSSIVIYISNSSSSNLAIVGFFDSRDGLEGL